MRRALFAGMVLTLCVLWAADPIYSQNVEQNQQPRPPQPTQSESEKPAPSNEGSAAPRDPSLDRGTIAPLHPPSPAAQSGSADHTNDGQNKGTSKDWSKIFLDHLPDWFVALFTAVLSLFTFLLWRSTDKLWKAGEEQRKSFVEISAVQSGDMKESIAVARVASKAAAESNRLARVALIASQRPWLMCKLIAVSDIKMSEDGLRVTVRPILTNIGKTPAVSVHTRVKIIATGLAAPNPTTVVATEVVEHQAHVKASGYAGDTIFPDEAGVSLIFPLNLGMPALDAAGILPAVMPVVVVCVIYQSVGSEEFMATTTYDLSETGGAWGSVKAIQFASGEIPQKNISVIRGRLAIIT